MIPIRRLFLPLGLMSILSLLLLWLGPADLPDFQEAMPFKQLPWPSHILGPVQALATQGLLSSKHRLPTEIWKQHHRGEVSNHKQAGKSSNLSRVLVAGYTVNDDISWIAKELPEAKAALYSVDEFEDSLQVPINKGHEAMVYLTYIIDHFYNLPDIVIFIHAHRLAWHNLDLLDGDAVQMHQRLRSEHVIKEGYVNLRCDWHPGCPTWLFPHEGGEPMAKQEQSIVAKCWRELFPLDEIPTTLAQPCCAQFAVSKDRIQSIPLQRFIHYRDWLLHTPLTDYFSGRIWEFVWQFVFSGKNVVCPPEQDCYCSTYGICFEPWQYEELAKLRKERQGYRNKLLEAGKVAKEGSDANDESAEQKHWKAETQRLSLVIEARKGEAIGRTSLHRTPENSNQR